MQYNYLKKSAKTLWIFWMFVILLSFKVILPNLTDTFIIFLWILLVIVTSLVIYFEKSNQMLSEYLEKILPEPEKVREAFKELREEFWMTQGNMKEEKNTEKEIEHQK